LPGVLSGGPARSGRYMLQVYGFTQHAGMGENVLDHRLNSRTVKMCAVNRFLYWNMNYPVEHHMFPMVPYYRLPELHEEIKHDCAPVYPSMWAAYKEFIPAVLRQLRDQEYYVRRELLPGAALFNEPTPLNDGRAAVRGARSTPGPVAGAAPPGRSPCTPPTAPGSPARGRACSRRAL